MSLKKLCLFSSYSESTKIDNYIKHYLSELKFHFDEIIFITNLREIEANDVEYLKQSNIKLLSVPNQGYDFGMYWHVLKDLDVKQYLNVAFVNDSCYLFKSLSQFFLWNSNQNIDVAGITDSIFKGHHIQSYFVIFNRRVLNLLKAYFVKNGIIDDVHRLIETYEIGLCKYLVDSGFRIGAMYSQKLFKNHASNIMTEAAQELLAKGIPLIKRKLVHNTFRDDEISYLEHVKFDFTTDYRKLLYSYADSKLLDYLLQAHSAKVYQIYYDLEQIKYLSTDTLPYYNSKLTVFFENALIKNFYNENKIEADYFGVLSWRFAEKNGFQYKSYMIDGVFDMYAFPNSARRHDVFADSVTCHPYFMEIFSMVLKNLKIDTNIKPMLGLYMNNVIARTHIYKKYVEEYLLPTIALLEKFEEKYVDLNQKLWSDARYKYDTALTQRLFELTGKPYYTYHTFILERLWSVFYHMHQNKYSLKIIEGDKMPVIPITGTRNIVQKLTPPAPRPGSVVEAAPPTPIVKLDPDKKDFAICIAHLQDRHIVEKINQENIIYDFYLASVENLNISKWQNFFKKHKIISNKAVDDVTTSKLNKQALLNVYLCSAVNQLLQEEEQVIKQKYKLVVFANNLSVLSNTVDAHKVKVQSNTLYVKKGPCKYWFGKADLMNIFSNIFLDNKHFQNGNIDDVIMQFALRRNIKIIEI